MKKLLILFLLLATSLWGHYSEEYRDFSEKSGKPIAIGITAYNRPEYLKKALEALAQNPESKEMPFIFFLDGGPNAKQHELIKVIDSFHFPHTFIFAFPENLGCERSTIELRDFLFDYCGFAKAVILEDDVIIPKNGVGLLLRMHAWAEQNIPHFGAISLSNGDSATTNQEKLISSLTVPKRALMSKKSSNLKKGSYGNMIDSPHNATYYQVPWCWAYALSREVWKKIRGTQLEFLSLFVSRAHPKEIDHPAIRHWLLGKLIAAKENLGLFDSSHSEILGDPYFIPKGSGQDGVFDVSLREQGLLHIVPVVNRIANIGEHGDHFGPSAWRLFCKNLQLSTFPEDAHLDTFTFLTKPPL